MLPNWDMELGDLVGVGVHSEAVIKQATIDRRFQHFTNIYLNNQVKIQVFMPFTSPCPGKESEKASPGRVPQNVCIWLRQDRDFCFRKAAPTCPRLFAWALVDLPLKERDYIFNPSLVDPRVISVSPVVYQNHSTLDPAPHQIPRGLLGFSDKD